jgi:uncharacterized membrane protein
MNHVFNRWGAAGWAVLFVVGLLVYAGAADRLDSKRSDEVATAKACSQAVEAAGETTVRLPAACDPYFTP